MRRMTLFFAMLVGFVAFPAFAQASTVSGKVTSDGNPAQGRVLLLTSQSYQKFIRCESTTDQRQCLSQSFAAGVGDINSDGTYTLYDINAGDYYVIADVPGQNLMSQEVFVNGDMTDVDLNF